MLTQLIWHLLYSMLLAVCKCRLLVLMVLLVTALGCCSRRGLRLLLRGELLTFMMWVSFPMGMSV